MVFLLATLSVIAATAKDRPLSLHPNNPHYFLWRGQPTVLITSAEHYGALVNLDLPATASRQLTVGLRASALHERPAEGEVALVGKVELAEISGSDTFVHADTPVGEVVAQLTGVHYFELGSSVTLYFSPAQMYLFDEDGALLLAPVRGGGR